MGVVDVSDDAFIPGADGGSRLTKSLELLALTAPTA